MRKLLYMGVASVMILSAQSASAEEVTAEMHLLTDQGIGKSIGTVMAEDSDNGLVLKMDLSADLQSGPHGFHVHENGSCDPAEKDGNMVPGLAAGGHYDPAGTGKHRGPSGDGHLGDLPIIYVGADGDGAMAVKHGLVAPRLKVSDIRGRALMIHSGGDNFSDEPKALGGGGSRVACGVFSQ